MMIFWFVQTSRINAQSKHLLNMKLQILAMGMHHCKSHAICKYWDSNVKTRIVINHFKIDMPMLASARSHTGANNKSYDSCIIKQWNANANINSNDNMNKNLDSKTQML